MLRYMLDTVQKVARGGILATLHCKVLRLSLDQWISEIAIMSYKVTTGLLLGCVLHESKRI